MRSRNLIFLRYVVRSAPSEDIFTDIREFVYKATTNTLHDFPVDLILVWNMQSFDKVTSYNLETLAKLNQVL